MVTMSAAKTAIRRALLYVPGSSQKMLEKTRGLNADCVAYDLEDSVTPSGKDEARSNLRRLLQQPRPAGVRECAVRINAVGTGFEAHDMEAVVRSDAYTLPSLFINDFRSMYQVLILS